MTKKRQSRKARQREKRRLTEADDKPGEDEAAQEAPDESDAGMSEIEIRQAGGRIDLPFEAPAPKTESMLYDDGRTMDDILRERDPSPFKKREDDADTS